MPAPASVIELVERFARNLDAYKRPDYKETRVRVEFVDPFFEALGWDVRNVQGYAEQYKDVVHEDAVKVGGVVRAPDYCFRVGGARKFFLEVKKPAVSIKEDVGPAYQLRRYAWSAKLPLSILTDFEEFAVYDCRRRPQSGDKVGVGRVMYLTFDQYPERFDEIHAVFARESVLRGSFDRYAEETTGKRGTSEVDAEFLKEIEGWRDVLARVVALRNPALSVHELNFAVQRTIDRIIFLRICEDRGVEEYGRLLALTGGPHIYPRLHDLYRQAEEKYNSGIFDFEADGLTMSLTIDDKVLKPILANLYYPHSPYEFSVLPADILGQVYEQFLGKVIRLTPAHRAVVEEKPEVKKAGGVYYTPTYIVDYIVRQTVGRLVEGKTPRQIAGTRGRAPLRILDPACGSGSFLLGAYQYLLDYHRQWYEEHDPAKHAQGKRPVLYQGPQGDWRLTTAEKKRILLDHIYGVDLDRQAVEVTKLSLLLEVLEGESDESIGQQLSFFQERALPNLDDNIKCGNSLIGPDYFAGQLMPDEEELRRVNPFDWEAEFPEAMGAGGFDAVIGNPPYIRIQTMKAWAPAEVEFYKRDYRAASKGNYDIYVVFVERGLQLLNERGRLGFILPHKFFNAQYGAPLRELIAEGRHLVEIIHFGDQQVFDGATTYTCLLFLDKADRDRFRFVEAHDLEGWRAGGEAIEGEVKAGKVTEKEWNFVVGPGAALFERLSEMPVRLGDVARIFQGLVTGADKVFILEQVESLDSELTKVRDSNGTELVLERGILKPFIKGMTVSTFSRPEWQHRIIFPYNLRDNQATLISSREMAKLYPRTWEYLKGNAKILRDRERGKWDHAQWYAFGRSQNLTEMEDFKLIVQVISLFGRYAYDNTGLYFTGGGNGPYYGVRWHKTDDPHSLHYLQAILGSPVLDFYLYQVSSPFRGGYWSYGKRFIEQLPIRTINFSDPADAARHERMVALVEQMLALHQKLAAATVPADRTLYQRQIEATDRRIDALVYELYGLTEEEIVIVENA
ncbi:MAG TPA: restriction endonuclease subunit M [Phycisphaerales bacterium]|nr:restriction endonuclease subunit M [Phycisphaerales bacterium]